VGSIPITRWSLKSAHLAQSVEHFLGKEEVDGSIPLVGFDHKQKKREQNSAVFVCDHFMSDDFLIGAHLHE
jgi:hypothetical protein